MINKIGPKIDPCGTPKSIFRKPLNFESTLIFCLLAVIQIDKNK